MSSTDVQNAKTGVEADPDAAARPRAAAHLLRAAACRAAPDYLDDPEPDPQDEAAA